MQRPVRDDDLVRIGSDAASSEPGRDSFSQLGKPEGVVAAAAAELGDSNIRADQHVGKEPRRRRKRSTGQVDLVRMGCRREPPRD